MTCQSHTLSSPSFNRDLKTSIQKYIKKLRPSFSTFVREYHSLGITVQARFLLNKTRILYLIHNYNAGVYICLFAPQIKGEQILILTLLGKSFWRREVPRETLPQNISQLFFKKALLGELFPVLKKTLLFFTHLLLGTSFYKEYQTVIIVCNLKFLLFCFTVHPERNGKSWIFFSLLFSCRPLGCGTSRNCLV